MKEKHFHPVWIETTRDGMKRYYREAPGETPAEKRYSLRRVMDIAPPGQASRRRWALFAGNQRVWEVQPVGNAGAAIQAAEDWIGGDGT